MLFRSSATPPATAHRLVQIERYQAPTVTDTLPAAAPPEATTPSAGHSMTAQLLATLAAALVGWLMIGFGSVRRLNIRAD